MVLLSGGVLCMMELSFENCSTLIECVNRYQYYANIVAKEDRAVLDWAFYAYIHDNLEDDLWEATK